MSESEWSAVLTERQAFRTVLNKGRKRAFLCPRAAPVHKGQGAVAPAAPVVQAPLSQTRAAVGSHVPGHARGHTRAPLNSDFIPQDTNCVEMFSRNCSKSAFTCRADQDWATHVALRTVRARVAMRKLNEGSLSEQVKVEISRLDLDMVKFNYGSQISGPVLARYVVLVLRRAGDGDKLHIHNSYPINWKSIHQWHWRSEGPAGPAIAGGGGAEGPARKKKSP